MASVKKDFIANLAGKVWSGAIAILLVPQYIKYLGIESYGLIGFYATLLSSMMILDFGLSTTLNRELSRFRSTNGSVSGIRDLVFSLEIIYWLIGMLICGMVLLFSGFIATSWVKVETLPASIVRESVMMMGVVIAFQWPISLYSGGLTGLGKQVLNNSVTVIMNTLRAAGVLVILKFFSPTLQAFFLWQALLSLVYVLVMRFGLWKKIPAIPVRPKFSKTQLKIVWRFAAGMTGISIITFFLSQIDKIVLSKILLLSQFGYYNLAFTVATGVSLIVGPISITFFPRFSSLIAAGDENGLVTLYHKACSLMSALIFPICFVLLFFMKDIIFIWTNNMVIANNTFVIAQVLVVGSVFNSLMVMPYNLLLANGRTKFTIIQNFIAALVVVPLLFVLTKIYGAIGAAYVWLILNVGYVFISQPLMHRTLLRTELWKWYIRDTLMPMIPPLIILILIKLLTNSIFGAQLLPFYIIAAISLATISVSVLSLPSTRQALALLIKRKSTTT